MGFQQRVERRNAHTYVLPRVGGMRCEVTAFLSDALFADTDEALWADAAASASYPGAKAVYLMPDCHLGYVLPIGGVLVTEGVLVQAGSGYDISCGVVQLAIPGLHAADVADRRVRERWVAAVEQRVATGNHSRQPARMQRTDRRLLQEVLRTGAAALGVGADVCERQFIPLQPRFDETLVKDRQGDSLLERAAAQLGSVGGGNHFVELQVDRDDGSVWAMVHCGSRAYGWQTANHFFHAGAVARGLPKNRREHSWLSVDEPLGRQYWNHHNSAANYAVANRHRIVQGVAEATRQVFGRDVETYFEISHNLVQEETLRLPDGSTTRGFVHRKGATRAFPAGHPDLAGTRWEQTGHPCLIPGSMFAGAAILFPEPGAWASACSVNHGAGRSMGRMAAKRDLHSLHDAIDAEMHDVTRTLGGVPITGIVGNCTRTPLDECGHVYKDLDAVLDVLVAAGIARIARRLYPVANLKGNE